MGKNGFYNDLIVRFLQNSITENEAKLLKHWIEESEENRKTFNSFRMIWSTSELVKDDSKATLNREKTKLKNILLFKNTSQNVNKTKNAGSPFYYLKYAAIALLSFSLSWIAYSYLSKQGQINRSYSEIIVPLGSKTHIVLPDGTDVWLNAGSSIKYPAQFTSSERRVELSGEGYFNVTKELQRKFVVATSNIGITVLGTTFNVKAYPEESIIETTLIEGKIELYDNHILKKGKPLIMKPGQKVSYVKNVKELQKSNRLGKPVSPSHKFFVKNNINTDVYTSWKTGQLIIEDKPLGDIAIILERKFDVKFLFAAENLKHYKFSGVLKDETLQQILYVLEFTSPIKYSIHGKNIIINSSYQ